MLPWWAGAGLALVSYLMFHAWAGNPGAAPPARPDQAAAIAFHGMKTAVLPVLQYLLPALFLFAAAASVWRRRQRQALAKQAAAQQDTAQAMNGMSWQEFEQLVGEAFRQRGYQITETGGGGADGGIDLVLRKGSEKLLVQCKQWRATLVSVNVVRELYGLVAAEGATGGVVVTSGRYSPDAQAFAEGRNLQLIDGDTLHGWLQEGSKSRSVQARQPRRDSAAQTPIASPTFQPAAIQHTSTCAQCGKPMLRRLAKRGSNAGQEFWGCSGYPQCRGTKAI
jgi:restriction system protein